MIGAAPCNAMAAMNAVSVVQKTNEEDVDPGAQVRNLQEGGLHSGAS